VSGTEPSIQVLVTPAGIPDLEARDHFCFVIDVLRACTSIAFALEAGARGVIPVETIEEATRLFSTLDRDSTLLCGERGSVPIEGFHLGNSPGEYVPSAVKGKTLVLATSNGAKALAALTGAKGCAAAALVNAGACARAAEGEEHVTIVCAGSQGRFSSWRRLRSGRPAYRCWTTGREPPFRSLALSPETSPTS
jgi:2-phosphosulfolactate phosphatase